MTHDQICKHLFSAIKDKTPEQIKAEMLIKGSRCHIVSRLLKRYHASEAAAKRFGYIGVGCISFAEARTALFVKRANITL